MATKPHACRGVILGVDFLSKDAVTDQLESSVCSYRNNVIHMLDCKLDKTDMCICYMLYRVYVRSDPDDNNAVDECAVDQIW